MNSTKLLQHDYDLQMAMQLQRQFDTEKYINSPPKDLTYEKKFDKSKSAQKGLIDPSWELVDPTPNVFILFTQFDNQFFSQKLGTVSVSWSKRMTSCAGICTYSYRGGMCKITLSEPLLKLRPRKDLVETLLHEMIHAFLFVTHNNKDRDGHGPEFRKHMQRINCKAGTNITIYHDFHDEVRLYQQHWWRCNGPCQFRKPFFGVVRRAMNRAPGPSDRWFADHQKNCGGKFIKVREPENKKQKKIETANSKNDIRNYITSDKQQETKVKSPECTSDFDYSIVRNHWLQKYENSSPKSSKRKSTDSIGESSNKKVKNNVITPTKSADVVSCPICGYETTSIKINDHLDVCVAKNESENDTTLLSDDSNRVKCPACNKYVPENELNEHLDTCLTDEHSKEKNCELCNSFILEENYDLHAETCLHKFYDHIEAKYNLNISKSMMCLVCNKSILKTDLVMHLDECMIYVFDDNKPENKFCDDDDDVITVENDSYNCPFCLESIKEKDMDSHINICLKGLEKDACPMCHEKITKESYEEHLRTCLSTTDTL